VEGPACRRGRRPFDARPPRKGDRQQDGVVASGQRDRDCFIAIRRNVHHMAVIAQIVDDESSYLGRFSEEDLRHSKHSEKRG
jgi:hypothetical protein